MYRLRCKGWMSLLAVCLVWAFGLARAAGPDTVVSDRVKPLTRAMSWRQTGAIPVNFNTYHPQGMVKIGDVYYASSVDIKTPTKRFAQPQGGYDRDTGEGVGHLFKFDAKAISSPTLRSAKARSITRAASTTTAATSGCPSPNTVRTAAPSSIASIRKP